jgi:nucleotide-binding universal stress UspA family protein
MTMYRTIVVGCDGTEHEANAIALAQQLLDPTNGRLILVNAFSPSELAFDYAGWLAERSDAILERAEANVQYGVACERRRASGPSVAAALDATAEAVLADLIVLGDAHAGLDLMARGTARGLLHGAPCAVAVASPNQSERFAGTPRICVAYDASPEARAALDAAYRVADATSATVQLYYALEPYIFATGFAVGPAVDFDQAREDGAHARLEEAAERAPEGVAVECHVLRGGAARAVADAAAGADLLVTGSRGFGALHRVVVGSSSSGLLRDGRTPLLVTPRVLVGAVPDADDRSLVVGVAR